MARTEPNYPDKLPFSPRLASLKSTRTTFSRILRAYADGSLDNDTMRTYCYVFQTMLAIQKGEADYSVVDRLKELECRLGAIEKGKQDEGQQQSNIRRIK